jgi:hypothetical protein
MRHTVRRAGSSSLGAALVLAAPASSMSAAVLRPAAFSRLGATQVLAAPAAAMRLAYARVASS